MVNVKQYQTLYVSDIAIPKKCQLKQQIKWNWYYDERKKKITHLVMKSQTLQVKK